MRTSRLARDTAKILPTLPSSPTSPPSSSASSRHRRVAASAAAVASPSSASSSAAAAAHRQRLQHFALETPQPRPVAAATVDVAMTPDRHRTFAAAATAAAAAANNNNINDGGSPADAVPSPSPSPSLSSAASSFAPDEGSDQEDWSASAASSRKRKRGQQERVGVGVAVTAAARGRASRGVRTMSTRTNGAKTKAKTETKAEVAVVDRTKPTPKKARRTPAKKVVAANGRVRVEAPHGWEELYAATKEFRKGINAPVDTMGCERLADPKASEKDQRFQTLVSLMLSSQTKDTVTAAAMRNLQQKLPGSLTVDSIIAVSPSVLNSHIEKVGFHNNKTKYIKQAAEILRDRYNSDIPDTIDGLVALPGVGPKMAYLCMSAAWGRDEGIGVDVHVHRITNLWGWHKTKTPEETRERLEAWLPRDKWHEINALLVGLGQTVCLPVGRRCGECALAEKGLCPGAVVGKKVVVKEEKSVVSEERDDGARVEVEEEAELMQQEDIKAEDVASSGVADIEDLISGPQPRRRSGRAR